VWCGVRPFCFVSVGMSLGPPQTTGVAAAAETFRFTAIRHRRGSGPGHLPSGRDHRSDWRRSDWARRTNQDLHVGEGGSSCDSWPPDDAESRSNQSSSSQNYRWSAVAAGACIHERKMDLITSSRTYFIFHIYSYLPGKFHTADSRPFRIGAVFRFFSLSFFCSITATVFSAIKDFVALLVYNMFLPRFIFSLSESIFMVAPTIRSYSM